MRLRFAGAPSATAQSGSANGGVHEPALKALAKYERRSRGVSLATLKRRAPHHSGEPAGKTREPGMMRERPYQRVPRRTIVKPREDIRCPRCHRSVLLREHLCKSGAYKGICRECRAYDKEHASTEKKSDVVLCSACTAAGTTAGVMCRGQACGKEPKPPEEEGEEEEEAPPGAEDVAETFATIVLCNGCNTCYHIFCEDPDGMPHREWLCHKCARSDSYSLDGVLDKRTHQGRVEYLVRWAAHSGRDDDSQTCWQAAADIAKGDEAFAAEKIAEFNRILRETRISSSIPA